MKQEMGFLDEPLGPSLLRYISQLAFSLLLQAVYGMTDLWVVGRFCGTASISAVSSGTLVTSFLTAMITGLTTGATILLARAVGKQDDRASGSVLLAEIALIGTMAIAIAVLTAVFAGQIASLIRAPAPAWEETAAYVRICGIGFVWTAAYNVVNSLFRSRGDARRPLQFVAAACGVNLVLDLWLVGVLHLGAAGAAVATTCAQAVSALLPLLYLHRAGWPLPRRGGAPLRPAMVRILQLGGPLVLNDLLTSVSFLLVTGRINALGLVASSSFGIAEKLFNFLVLVPTAFLNGLASVVAQNLGAGKPDRARRALQISCAFSLCFGIAVFFLAHWFGTALASFFERDPLVIAATADYLRAGAFEYLFVSLSYCFQGYFNGCGRTRFVTGCALVCAFGIRLPLTFYAAARADPSMGQIGAAVSVAAGVQALLIVGHYLRTRRPAHSGG